MKRAGDLAARLEQLNKKVEQRKKNKRSDDVREIRKEQKVVQLPLWPEFARGVPNSVLRSALFGIVRRGRRAYLERKEIASVDGITIIFSGPQLDQSDLDVWEQCLHIARSNNLGNKIYFTAHSFLKGINRGTGKSQHEWLKGAFARLSTSAVEITDGQKAYFGAMIYGGARDDQSGKYFIEINPKIMALYGHDSWTGVEFDQRLALKSQPLAQWLHGFYSTHAQPYPYKVETIKRLCGSETKQSKHFKEQLKKAIAQVSGVTGWEMSIQGDLLHVKK